MWNQTNGHNLLFYLSEGVTTYMKVTNSALSCQRDINISCQLLPPKLNLLNRADDFICVALFNWPLVLHNVDLKVIRFMLHVCHYSKTSNENQTRVMMSPVLEPCNTSNSVSEVVCFLVKKEWVMLPFYPDELFSECS